MDSIRYCLWIALAGGLGSLARHLLTELGNRWLPGSTTWSILFINIAGCFLFGLFYALGLRGTVSMELRGILLIGFFGGFTTFSSFAFHNQQMIVQQQWGALLLNVLVQNVVGILAVGAGIKLPDLIQTPIP